VLGANAQEARWPMTKERLASNAGLSFWLIYISGLCAPPKKKAGG
jgi:hypothetical protein